MNETTLLWLVNVVHLYRSPHMSFNVAACYQANDNILPAWLDYILYISRSTGLPLLLWYGFW